VKGAPFSATKFDDPEYQALFDKALTTADEKAHADVVHQMQKIDYDRGGNIIPYFFPVIDAAAKNVQGILPGVSGVAMNTFSFRDFWMD
jgi:peptide/nickel transport system substrate-binding protein